MNRLYYIAAGAVLTSCGGSALQQSHPNIVYVFPDQMRSSAMSIWDEEQYDVPWEADPVRTPSLERFAHESLVLSNAMSTCPLSSPYRGMMLTGMYPERSGVVLNCMALRPESTLSTEAVCISDVLKAQGYSCGYIGKLHAETPMRNDPQHPGEYVSERRPEWDAYTPEERRHGFDYWYSYGTYDVHNDPHYWDTEGHRHDPHEFSVEHETTKAIEYLQNKNGERDPGKPFMLMVAYNPPHSPYECSDDCLPEDYALYADRSLDELYVRPNADTTLSKAPSMRYYLANVTAVDRGFGRILDELKRLGLEDNTIVVFTSDHGETMCSHGTLDPKNSIYTESFNVPFIIRYPGRVPVGFSKHILTTTDIMPTLLSLAGYGDAIPETVQGRDLSSELLSLNAPASRDAALYMRNLDGTKDAEGLVHGYFPEARGVRTSRYTMEVTITRDTTLRRVLLYDDIADPYQMKSLDYTEHEELFEDLLSSLSTLLKEADDPWYREGILSKIFTNTI